MSDIEWSDPPPSNRGGYRDSAGRRFVAALHERPGQWAKYPKRHSSASGAGYYRQTYPDIEWTARKREDGRYDMYGRYPST